MFSPGDRVDRYIIGRQLGSGGTAEVWQVRHALLGTPFALKILSSTQRDVQMRLLREGRAQSVLQHPNILPVRDAFWVRGHMALLMPLNEGPSLRRVMSAGALPLQEVLSLARSILDGLALVHANGMVHCDLKPENILLDLQHDRLCPKITDFGLVNVIGDEPLGTPAYVPPELISGGNLGPRADLFSLGAVLYELLMGTPVFSAQTLAQAALRAVPDTWALPQVLEPLIREMLSLDPAQRPSSCQDVLHRLPPVGALSLSSVAAERAASLRLPPVAAPMLMSGMDRADAVPHNLPPENNRFIGRERELGDQISLLEGGVRALALVGLGGIGKTRLALQLARSVRRAYAGGVWWCPFCSPSSADDLSAVVGAVLGCTLDSLSAALAARGSLLLVLDGTEHLSLGALERLSDWLEEAPLLQVVMTSRLFLMPRQGTIVRLGPMSQIDARELYQSRALDAGQLRANIIDVDVDLLTTALDHIPLAIELAASRAMLLSPREFIERLRVYPELLYRPSGPCLEAVYNWTWSQLSPNAQLTLLQLSVLESDFSIRLSERIVQIPNVRMIDDIIQELLSIGLIRVYHKAGKQRLRLLVTLQQFVQARLSLKTREQVLQRLMRTCLRLSQLEAVEERSHVFSSAYWALQTGAPSRAGWLVHAALQASMQAGEPEQGIELLESLVARELSLPRPLEAFLQLDRAWSMRVTGRMTQAMQAVDHAESLFSSVGDQRGAVYVRMQRGYIHRARGHHTEAVKLLETLAPETGSVPGSVRLALGDSYRQLGRYEDARRQFAKARAERDVSPVELAIGESMIAIEKCDISKAVSRLTRLLESHPHPSRDRVLLLISLSRALLFSGNHAEANQYFQQAQQQHKTLGRQVQRADLFALEAQLRIADGSFADAEACLHNYLDTAEFFGDEAGLAYHRALLAQLRSERGHHAEARDMAAAALRQSLQFLLSTTPIIAARMVIVCVQDGALGVAESVIEASPEPKNFLARFALDAALAQLETAKGTPRASMLRRRVQQQLRDSQLSSSSALGRLCLGGPRPLSLNTTYVDTMPKAQ